MSKYAKKIVIRVFRENSWPENRVFMATITPRKKRHAIISQEINTETNKMKDWSRKRKTDFIIKKSFGSITGMISFSVMLISVILSVLF